ncbi:MAG TPA: hypothetical protein VMW08_12855 [Acidimicrobiales bacterium]|nr:hypothetical protein [Acidimicrobiales bacterium]
MKLKIPLSVLLLALIVAYLLGTDSGRGQRDMILAKIGRGPAPAPEGEATVAA